MRRLGTWADRRRASLHLALGALRAWTPRQVVVAIVSAIVVAAVMGVVTVLIPNPVFGRDIAPLAWNYPVWIMTAALTGMIIATYVRTDSSDAHEAAVRQDRRSARMGGAAGLLAWFAVGCPVCNKIALLALGYTGALTWFAPLQPVLAVVALVLSTMALWLRLRGQISCPLPTNDETVMR